MFLKYVLGHRKHLGAAEPSFIWNIIYNGDGFFCQKTNVKIHFISPLDAKKDASMPKNGGRLKGKENESWLETYIFVFFRSFTFLNEVVEFETNIVFLWSLACTILKVQQ